MSEFLAGVTVGMLISLIINVFTFIGLWWVTRTPPDVVASSEVECVGEWDEIITVTYESGDVARYRGGLFVWFDYPGGGSVGADLGRTLQEISRRAEWAQEGPP